MFIIPFANPIVPALSDRTNTGGLHSTIPLEQPVAAVSTAASPANTLLLIGDNTAGVIAWSDETTDANNSTMDDTPIFNSSGDMYYIAFSAGDKIESLDWYCSTAGSYVGTVTANITYRNSSGVLVEHNGVAVPDFRTIGVKRLMLPSSIDYSNMGEMDDPRNPRNARQRAIVVEFNGITSITTSPLAQRFWKRRTSDSPRIISSFTSLLNSVNKTAFNAITIMPLAGDRSLLGFTNKTAAIFSNVERIRDASWQTKSIYSRGSGLFGDYPTADLLTPSAASGNEMWSGGIGNFVDIRMPQSDWGTDTITDPTGTNTLYWVGWEYLADATQPSSVLLATAWGGALMGTNSIGAIAGENATYTKLELFARTPITDPTWIVISNKRTNVVVVAKLASNGTYTTTTISLSVIDTDELVIQCIRGGAVFNAADAMLRLS